MVIDRCCLLLHAAALVCRHCSASLRICNTRRLPTCVCVALAVSHHRLMKLLLQPAVKAAQQRRRAVGQRSGVRCKGCAPVGACLAQCVLYCCCQGCLDLVQVVTVLLRLPALQELQSHSCMTDTIAVAQQCRMLTGRPASH
jgi:hypothetical protein